MQVNFYHLTVTPLAKALPRLLEKVLESNKRALILTSDENQAEEVNRFLWTYHPQKFLPHGSVKDDYPEEQPVFITYDGTNANNAEVAVDINCIVDPNAIKGDFARLLFVFDGNDPAMSEKAEKLWSEYRSSANAASAVGDSSYLKQDDKGKWQAE